jgi:hypothetical protein
VASYSAGRDIAAELTNLDIAATDHIRPIATTTAIPTMNGCICTPLRRIELGHIGLTYFAVPMRLPVTSNVRRPCRVTPAEAARQAGLLKSANAVRRKGAPGP